MSDAKVTFLAAGLDHPEGIAWDPQGRLICGGEEGQLHWLDPASGQIDVRYRLGAPILGVALDAGGSVYCCEMESRSVVRVDPSGGHTVYSSGAPERAFSVPNYCVFDDQGYLYVSDSGTWSAEDGAILVVEPTSGRTRIASHDARAFPNGLAIDPPGEYLFVVESSPPALSRLRLLGGGRLGPRERVHTMAGTVPDGLAFCADGRLLISCYRPDAVFIWDGETRQPLAEDWTGRSLIAPTNLAYFGDRLERLAAVSITTSVVMEISDPPRGAPVRRPRVPR